ncbi:hypothetical protein [Labrys okinawensis]|uniref:hypothetical protein n=1 Tax=Labrys okinawensis TaxID=346911 RepID=UPI0015E43633|nr:hypothetical protein [Labrys okinawensis]
MPTMSRGSVLALVLASGLVLPATAQQQPAPAPGPPAPANAAPAGPQPMNLDSKTVLMLVRSTLIALDQANKTGNYSVLRDLGSAGFQRENSDAKLAEIFAGQRKAGLDLAAALVLEPTITLSPQVEKSGLLHLAGYFPVKGDTKLTFELLFQGADRRLLVDGISVNIAQAGSTPGAGGSNATQIPVPAAPAAEAPAAPAPAAAPGAKPKPKPKPKPEPKPEPAPAQ